MFEYHNNILCVHAGWLIEKGIVSKCNYDKLKRQSKIEVLRRGCYGVPALVAWSSLPERFREKVKALVGVDPERENRRWYFSDYLKTDEQALKFFRKFIKPNGKSLTHREINAYHAKVMVFNAIRIILEKHSSTRRALGKRDTQFWKNVTDVIHKLDTELYPHRLPKNYRRLREKYYIYVKNGYEALIHGGVGNSNTQKLTAEAQAWLLSRWADPINKVATVNQLWQEYNEEAVTRGWDKLKSERTIDMFLHQEDIQHLWWHARYGERVAKERYTYHIGTRMPTYRDSLWYADGTKLNLFYLDKDGKIATCTVYEVMDAYSEVFLGFAIGKTENYELQYKAFKMAAQVSGQKPYQIGFDNQGGHKKLTTGNFINNLCRLSVKTQPYNGKSKTIENAFGRFQQQYLKRLWNFTGQNITAKKQESKINREFLLANKDNLPTYDEMINQYRMMREKWNTAPHHRTGIPRIEMYYNSTNPESTPITIDDMVDLFWIERPQPVKLSPYGLTFRENGVKKHYMKYLNDGITPDVEWLKKNIDKKFTIKYDPEDESQIWLYEDTPTGKAFACALTPKIFVSRGKQEQTEEELQHINATLLANKKSRIETRDKMEAIIESEGASAETQGFNTPVISGVESGKRKKRRVVVPDYYKQESNSTQLDIDNNNDDDIDLDAWRAIAQ